MECRESSGLEPINLVIRRAEYGRLDVLNIKMMQIGSSDIWRWRELDRGDIRRRPGGIVLEWIWRVLEAENHGLSLLFHGLNAVDVHDIFHKMAPFSSVHRQSVQGANILVFAIHYAKNSLL